MEAGYFPRLVCALLIAVGAALSATALMRAGEVPERGRWRPLVFTFIFARTYEFANSPTKNAVSDAKTIRGVCRNWFRKESRAEYRTRDNCTVFCIS